MKGLQDDARRELGRRITHLSRLTWRRALAIGGGTVVNDGTITSAQRAITVDDSNLGNAFAATSLVFASATSARNSSSVT